MVTHVTEKQKIFFLSSHTYVIVRDPSHIRSHSIYIKDDHHHTFTCVIENQKFFFHKSHICDSW